jgi:hypothetical protein
MQAHPDYDVRQHLQVCSSARATASRRSLQSTADKVPRQNAAKPAVQARDGQGRKLIDILLPSCSASSFFVSGLLEDQRVMRMALHHEASRAVVCAVHKYGRTPDRQIHHARWSCSTASCAAVCAGCFVVPTSRHLPASVWAARGPSYIPASFRRGRPDPASTFGSSTNPPTRDIERLRVFPFDGAATRAKAAAT